MKQDNEHSSNTEVDDIQQESNETLSDSHSAGAVQQAQSDVDAAPQISFTVLSQSMQVLVDEMHHLRQDFDTKVKYDATKERQVDNLHRELQSYREGLHFKILRPLFIDLIAIHDDLDKLIESMPREETFQTVAQMANNLRSFQETVEEILQRNGVEVYSVEGDAYVPGKQRALQAIETLDIALDKQIAHRIRKGFEYDGKILRPELVVTYKVVISEVEKNLPLERKTDK